MCPVRRGLLKWCIVIISVSRWSCETNKPGSVFAHANGGLHLITIIIYYYAEAALNINTSEYRTKGLYRTPIPNPIGLVRPRSCPWVHFIDPDPAQPTK